MAPPPQRRPGFSRKAQYGIFAGYVLAVAGALAGALLLLLSVLDPQGFAALRTIARETTAPVARTLNGARQGIGDAGSGIAAYFDAGSKNAALQKRLAAYRTRLIEAEATAQENRRLRRMLRLVEKEPERLGIGRLISSSASSSRRLATLSIGSNFGVAPGQPVRAPQGLIGRVLEVGPTTASVLLITDPQNVVPVRRASDGLAAFSTGRADGSVELRPINAGQNPFRIGDIMVTSGNGGLYAPDIPVAQVRRLTSEGAIARPLASPADVDYAMVQKVYLPPEEPVAVRAAEDTSPPASSEQP